MKVSAKNEAFWALDKRNKRIAIAKDVIKWVEGRKFTPSKGIYLDFGTNPEKDGKLDTFLRKTECTACGLGACFIALVDLGNNIRISDVINEPEHYIWGKTDGVYNDYVDDTKMRDKLRKVFSPEQLGLIENAFETNGTFRDPQFTGDSADYDKKSLAARRFGYNYSESDNRLIAIMKNIIKWRGTFRPDKP